MADCPDDLVELRSEHRQHRAALRCMQPAQLDDRAGWDSESPDPFGDQVAIDRIERPPARGCEILRFGCVGDQLSR